MNTSLLKKFAVATLLAGTFFTAQAALKVGDTLPDLASFKLVGKLPDSLKGKIVVVDFWASWCLPCAKSFPVLDELQKKYGDRVVVLAVNVDEKAANMTKFWRNIPSPSPSCAMPNKNSSRLLNRRRCLPRSFWMAKAKCVFCTTVSTAKKRARNTSAKLNPC